MTSSSKLGERFALRDIGEGTSNVGPAVGGEDSFVQFLVEAAEVFDALVVAGGVFEKVVRFGQALVCVDHEAGGVAS